MTSCTTDISVLKDEDFLGLSGERTIFQILTSRAIDVRPFSALPKEAEVVLLPGSALTITGVLDKSADGMTIITCEDDEDAPELVS